MQPGFSSSSPTAGRLRRLKQLVRWFFPKRISPAPAGDDYSFLAENRRPTDDSSLFRGYFDNIRCENGDLVIQGWMISLQGPYAPVTLYLNEREIGPMPVLQRPDVAHRLPHIPRSLDCGFRVRIPLCSEELNGFLRISVRGMAEGREWARMETWFRCDLYSRLPAPPTHLIGRVDEMTDPEFYLLKGVQNYGEFWTLLEKHTDTKRIESLLDWGCGSGRLTGMFLEFSGIPDIHGCDIDAEAVAWCAEHWPKGTFSAIPPHPPIAYPDNRFDAVISFSVLTHLSREVQNEWLREMRRLLKPGGVFLATVHGLTAARTILPHAEVDRMLREGIDDRMQDHRLTGIAPDEYYRAVFQSRQYIQREWAHYFEMVDYIEQGASNYHDIVVMRKRPGD